MIQTKSYSISPPMNNLVYWVENSSENIQELFNIYYEMVDVIENSSNYKVHKNTIFGTDSNTMKITIWKNMN